MTTLAELSERNKLPVATHTLGRATIGAPPSPPLAMRVVLGGSVGAAFGLLWAMVKLPPRPARAKTVNVVLLDRSNHFVPDW